MVSYTSIETPFFSLIIELADDSDAYKKIQESHAKKVYLKEKLIWKILIQILKGLRVMHASSIVHRDMKSANIFLFQCG